MVSMIDYLSVTGMPAGAQIINAGGKQMYTIVTSGSGIRSKFNKMLDTAIY